MALNPDRPAGRRQQANPRGEQNVLRAVPVRPEIDRMVDEVQRGARKMAPEAVEARESEAMTRAAHDTILGRDRIVSHWPWPRPIVRGLLKRVAKTADSINLEFANFPFIGEPVYGFLERGIVRPIEETKQEAARSFYSILVHHEIFKAFKRANREERSLTSDDRTRIQKEIIVEQSNDKQEVVRQERTLEDFSRAIRQGRYGTAARTYERVAKYRNGWAMWEDCKKELKCKNEIEYNKNKKTKKQETEEVIRKRFFPDGLTENQRRNETLQKYLRITASRHIADMVEGRINNPHAQFLVMFQNFWPIEKLSRDDIPLDDAKIAVFFSEIRENVRDAIISAVRERQARQDAGQEGGVIGDARAATVKSV